MTNETIDRCLVVLEEARMAILKMPLKEAQAAVFKLHERVWLIDEETAFAAGSNALRGCWMWGQSGISRLSQSGDTGRAICLYKVTYVTLYN
jgi:hypothetical protein